MAICSGFASEHRREQNRRQRGSRGRFRQEPRPGGRGVAMDEHEAGGEEDDAGEVEPPRMKHGDGRIEVGNVVETANLEREALDKDVGGVVEGMAEHAQTEGAGAVVDPAEGDAEYEGDGSLGGVEMHDCEQHRGRGDGESGFPPPEQAAKNEAAKDDLLGERSDDNGEDGTLPGGRDEGIELGSKVPALHDPLRREGAEQIVDFREEDDDATHEERPGGDQGERSEAGVAEIAPFFAGVTKGEGDDDKGGEELGSDQQGGFDGRIITGPNVESAEGAERIDMVDDPACDQLSSDGAEHDAKGDEDRETRRRGDGRRGLRHARDSRRFSAGRQLLNC